MEESLGTSSLQVQAQPLSVPGFKSTIEKCYTGSVATQSKRAKSSLGHKGGLHSLEISRQICTLPPRKIKQMLFSSIRDGIKSNQKVAHTAHDSSTVGSWLSLLTLCSAMQREQCSAWWLQALFHSMLDYCHRVLRNFARWQTLNLILHVCISIGDRK